jgi:hypothetical protein
MKKPRKSLENRFFDKVEPGYHWDDCWKWTAAIDSTGYGRLGMGGRKAGTIHAHRLSFLLHNEFIPEGCEVCHHCNHRWCVNPLHLYAGTRSDNMKDCVRAGTHRGFENGVGVSIHEIKRRLS